MKIFNIATVHQVLILNIGCCADFINILSHFIKKEGKWCEDADEYWFHIPYVLWS